MDKKNVTKTISLGVAIFLVCLFWEPKIRLSQRGSVVL